MSLHTASSTSSSIRIRDDLRHEYADVYTPEAIAAGRV